MFHLGVAVTGACPIALMPTNISPMFRAERVITAGRITAIPAKYLTRAAMTMCALKHANSPSPFSFGYRYALYRDGSSGPPTVEQRDSAPCATVPLHIQADAAATERHM